MTAPAPGLYAQVRQLPPAAWVLAAGSFVNRFGSFVTAFLVLYLAARGFPPAQAGLALGAYGVGALAASAVGGLLADRLGRRSTIVVSMLSSATAMLLLAQAQRLALIIALSGLAGLCAELYRPASSALLADLVPPGRRVAAYAVYRLAVNAGFAAGPATAGFLAERSFTWIFVGDAATSVVFAVVALIALPHGTRSARDEEVRGEAARTVRADRRFLLFLGASLLAALVYMQAQSTFALHVTDIGLSPSHYGLLISLHGLLIVVFELPLVSVTHRLPARPVIAAGVILSGLGFALTGLAGSVLALALTVVVWTLGEMVAAPVGAAYVADIAPEHLRGRYSGAWGLTFGMGLVLAPVLGTAVYARSPGAVWIGCALTSLVAAGLVLFSERVRVAPSMVRPVTAPEVPGADA